MFINSISDQGTQTELLQITEPLETSTTDKPSTNGHYYHTIERESSSVQKDESKHNKLRRSASLSSSSNTSSRMGSSSSNNSTSTLSLRSSPLRSSCRTLKSDAISAYQKWETTVESISYVTTKTVAIKGFPTERKSRSTTTATSDNKQKQQHSSLNGVKVSHVKLTNGCNGSAEKGKFC